MPKVSVIMPSLNVAPYIRECIDSVCAQTLREIEILCVDAGSTDGTWEILEETAARDGRITLIRSEKKSYGYQVNLGMDRATGEYIGIVETDDYIEPDMYEKLYNAAKEEDLDILKADYYIATGDGTKRWQIPCYLAKRRWQYHRVFEPAAEPEVFNNTICNWAGIYRTDFLRQYGIRHSETPGASFQDIGFWFRALAMAKRMRFCHRGYYHLRRDNPGSSVYSPDKLYFENEEFDGCRSFLRQFPERERRLAGVCAYQRFRSGIYFSMKRLSEQNQHLFLERFAEDFRKIEAAGELDRSLFTAREWRALRAIMAEPSAYYRLRETKALPGENRNRLEGGWRCVREHGLRYTLRYLRSGKGFGR